MGVLRVAGGHALIIDSTTGTGMNTIFNVWDPAGGRRQLSLHDLSRMRVGNGVVGRE